MFKPNTTVAWVVVCQQRFLIVEEIDDGKTVFNQPAGHLEADESLLSAAKRELFEETGLELEPDYLVGIYQSEVTGKNIQYLRFCYVAELDDLDLPETAPQDSDITAAHWLTLKEIKQKSDQLRSPMVMQCIKDFLDAKRLDKKIPLDSIKSYL